jgi:hypothetical protein
MADELDITQIPRAKASAAKESLPPPRINETIGVLL